MNQTKVTKTITNNTFADNVQIYIWFKLLSLCEQVYANGFKEKGKQKKNNNNRDE